MLRRPLDVVRMGTRAWAQPHAAGLLVIAGLDGAFGFQLPGAALVGVEAACYNKVMKLPHGDHALVDDAKLRHYVLNPRHPVGRHHAALFERLLGIDLGNVEVLKDALRSAAAKENVTREVATPYGRKFEIRFPLSGPGGEKRVVSVWIVEEGSDRPRLVTCYAGQTMWKEHDVVTVTVDVPAEGLSAGDVGAIVHCYPDQNAYEVDFLNDQGRSKGVAATLSDSQLLRLNLISLVA